MLPSAAFCVPTCAAATRVHKWARTVQAKTSYVYKGGRYYYIKWAALFKTISVIANVYAKPKKWAAKWQPCLFSLNIDNNMITMN